MRIAVVSNPAAGKGRAVAAQEAALARLRGRADVVALSGKTAAESEQLCRESVAEGVDALVALGGDGMVNLALQAVAGTFTPLGVIPAGTGNDFAAHLGIPMKNPVAAADVVLAAQTRHIDAGRVGERWFDCIFSAGFDSACNERANAMRWPRGDARYLLATLATLPRFKPIPFEIVLDDVVWEVDAMLVAVANARSYGGGMKVAPDAELDDGWFDVAVLGAVGRGHFLRTFPKVFKGTHITDPAVTIKRARRVTLTARGVTAYADGEPFGSLPLTAECMPGALRVIAPAAG